MKRIISAVLILSLCCNFAAFSVSAADDLRVEVVIDTRDDSSPISPYIYGLVTDSGETPLRVNSVKQAAVEQVLYNWEQNFSNNGRANIIPGTADGAPGVTSPAFWASDFAQTAGNAEHRYITLPPAGFAAADDDGTVTRGDTSRFYPVIDNKPSELLTEPDITDGVVYTDEYISYLVNHYGYAFEGGISGYFLDRQPETHSALFPFLNLPQASAGTLSTDHISAAKTVKRIDSSALVMGPSVKNLEAYVNLDNTNDWNTYSNDWDWFIDYYLDRFNKASASSGMRLLDVLDLHYYTEAAGENGAAVLTSEAPEVREAREAAPRIFWDSTYNEASKSALSFKSKTPLLPTLFASIGIYYPGTELSFSEYAFGGGGDISGGIAAADALGIFGRNGVYSANMVTSDILYGGDNAYEIAAMRLFTDYDGNGGAFGSTSVSCDIGTDRMASAYAATEGGDPNMTVVYMNKNAAEDQTVMFSLYSDADYATASIYGFNEDSPEIRYYRDFTITGNTFTVLVPAQTVYLFKLSGVLREGVVTTVIQGENGETITEVVDRGGDPAQTTTFEGTTAPDQIITADSGYISHIMPEDETDTDDSPVPLWVRVIVIAAAAAVFIGVIWVLINIKKL
ncbi:MAG: glycoside hydrolase family 44 protein [Ruminococcus sp.]|jgi:mannan endo-1,4-beta-mannosidase|nr:glycoside hydrolase family 44 protein [Ruminococcus sp.]